MPNENKVFFAGHLGRDAEFRVANNNMPVAKFSLAVKETYAKDAKVAWVDVVAFGDQAEMAGELRKGAGVYVVGRISMDEWKDKDTGKNRTKLKVIADMLKVHRERPKTDRRQDRPAEAPSGAAQPGGASPFGNDYLGDGDEIPF